MRNNENNFSKYMKYKFTFSKKKNVFCFFKKHIILTILKILKYFIYIIKLNKPKKTCIYSLTRNL